MKIKNIGLASVMCMLCALPSYADIASGANSATCDNSTIGATSGSTDLEANWNANSITVNWYNGNTKITTNTCSYDGAVTIPATPTKAGYTFNGWHIRAELACYEMDNQTTCNANSAKGCAWDNWGCHVSSCTSFSDETTCSATPGCVWYHDCYSSDNHCTAFYEGTKCHTITNEEDCSASSFNYYDMCIWTGSECIYHVDIGSCVG